MKRTIETDYAPHMDITVIMEYIEAEDGTPIQSSIVGWYYGEPDEKSTQHFIGKLTATYTY